MEVIENPMLKRGIQGQREENQELDGQALEMQIQETMEIEVLEYLEQKLSDLCHVPIAIWLQNIVCFA